MSQSREDYLKFIYENQTGERMSNKVISQGLKVAPPSVSEMVLKLAEEGYVDYLPYHGAMLTPEGEAYAKSIQRKHLIWEYFLINALGYRKDQVHELAEILEHSTPIELAERIATYIDYPEDYSGPH